MPFVSDWLKQIGVKLKPQTLTSAKLGNVILAGEYDMFEWGWLPNPDPNYILNIFTCAQRPPDADTYRNSDMYYCNPDYDKMYDGQQEATSAADRNDIVHQMQSVLYRDQPYAVLWNVYTLEAWSPNWTGFQQQPADVGDMLATYGPFSFISLHPVTGRLPAPGGSGGIPAWVWVALIVVVAVVIFAVTRSRRRSEDEDSA